MSSEFHPCLSVFWQIEEINRKSGSSVTDNSTRGFQKTKVLECNTQAVFLNLVAKTTLKTQICKLGSSDLGYPL